MEDRSAARELPAIKALYLRLMVREGEMEPSHPGGSGPGGRAGHCLSRHCRGRPPLAGGKNGRYRSPAPPRFGQDASKGVSPFYDRI